MTIGLRPILARFVSRAALQRLFLVCALVAMTVKAALPMGYMLAQTGPRDAITIVLCTAAGSQSLIMGDYGSLHDDNDQDRPDAPSKSDHPCTFAGQSGVALAAADTLLQPITFTTRSTDTTTRLLDQVPGRGLAAPPPPATASPILI
ncbi:MAG: hypothetical protein RLZZ157_1251 [Pseudomonadota bacterium]|jgi:hypothetical protein